MKKIIVIITICFETVISFAQTNFFHLKPDTLIDKAISAKFVLDSLHQCIIAFDSTNKQLWLTDLYDAEKIFFRPKNKYEEEELSMDYIEVISLGSKSLSFESFHICYGTIDKESGIIQFSGCD